MLFFTACAKKESTDIKSLIESLEAESMSGEKVPDLILPNLDGSGNLSLAQFEGKLLVLNIWSSNCLYCNKEAPLMSQLGVLAKNNPKIQILGISQDKSEQDALDFVNEHGLTFPVMHNFEGSSILEEGILEIPGTPSTFIISPKGMVLGKIVGFHDLDPQTMFNTLEKIEKNSRK